MTTSKLLRLGVVMPLVLAVLACGAVGGGGGEGGGADGPHLGQFDCSGHEGGLLAYAGRFTFEANGDASFEDFDGDAHTGTFTYDEAEQSFTFGGGFVFDYAEYFADDTLTATLASGESLPHVESGNVDCERSVPGVTGP